MIQEAVERAANVFKIILADQLRRVEDLKRDEEWLDFSTLSPVVVGFAGGDGIGPIIAEESRRVLDVLLADEIASGTIEVVQIDKLTIGERQRVGKAVPPDVMEQARACHVLLKGPTETPAAGTSAKNIVSANVALRRELDLFANVRPVRVADRGIDWTFFRENTEGEYILGGEGIDVTDDLAIDFKATTTQGSERIIRLACEFARKTEKDRVTVVTKANVIKRTDGKFSQVARRVAGEYPDLELEEWYVDIMAAHLINPARQKSFQVIVLPNLYGDILTDEAAQLQGGVGTAGSANIGYRYAMFEAIHGSGTKMIDEGRGQYADPSSLLRALVLLLEHIGRVDAARRLTMALDVCNVLERTHVVTGRSTGVTTREFGQYILDTLARPDLERAAAEPSSQPRSPKPEA